MQDLKQTGVSPTRDGFQRKTGRFFRNLLIILLLVGGILIYWFFFNKYSDGERKGTLIKITHKGNVFKTDEGEMWLSCRQTMNPEKFYFSVVNDSIAQVLKNLQDECVQVTYVQYRAKLPWRGDSKYIVTGVAAIPSSMNMNQ
ncbi:MAG: 6-phosphogluconate dehydrogenase [Chitinophagaceae bacterium]|nr:6-phosphogluconate dehydrogenase [Chitinophagaceae bacterium]